MDNVIHLRGENVRTILSDALHHASEFQDVIVIARTKKDRTDVALSGMSQERAVWMLEYAKQFIWDI